MKLERNYEPTPLNDVAIRYKRELGIRADSLDIVAAMHDGMVATVKMDGELNAMHYKTGKATLANNGKRTRTDCPPTKEMVKLMPKLGIRSAVFMGELYAIGEDGGRIPFGDVQHIILKPTEAEEEQMRFAIFDVIQINGRMVRDNYWKRLALVTNLVKGSHYIHPVIAARVDSNLLRDMWQKEVLTKRMEGLVIHSKGRIVKVKVTTPQSVVVIGVVPGKGRTKGSMGSLVVAYMDSNGDFRYAGRVGTGFTDADRKAWWDFMKNNKVDEGKLGGKKTYMVRPIKVIEIASEAINISDREVLTFTNIYSVQSFKKPCGVGSKPRFLRIEEEKQVSRRTVGLGQVPDWEGEDDTRSNPIEIIDLTLLNPGLIKRFVSYMDASPREQQMEAMEAIGLSGEDKINPPLDTAVMTELPFCITPSDPLYGAYTDTVLGPALLEGWSYGASTGAFARGPKREVPIIATGENPPRANILSCPEDGENLVYYGRGHTPAERGVMVYRCPKCNRAYRKRRPGGGD